jgi:hypothetical protein
MWPVVEPIPCKAPDAPEPERERGRPERELEEVEALTTPRATDQPETIVFYPECFEREFADEMLEVELLTGSHLLDHPDLLIDPSVRIEQDGRVAPEDGSGDV